MCAKYPVDRCCLDSWCYWCITNRWLQGILHTIPCTLGSNPLFPMMCTIYDDRTFIHKTPRRSSLRLFSFPLCTRVGLWYHYAPALFLPLRLPSFIPRDTRSRVKSEKLDCRYITANRGRIHSKGPVIPACAESLGPFQALRPATRDWWGISLHRTSTLIVHQPSIGLTSYYILHSQKSPVVQSSTPSTTLSCTAFTIHDSRVMSRYAQTPALVGHLYIV